MNGVMTDAHQAIALFHDTQCIAQNLACIIIPPTIQLPLNEGFKMLA